MGRFTELFTRKRTPPTAKPAPRPPLTPAEHQAALKAQVEAEARERARRWEAAQKAEWRERVQAAHEALVAKLTRDGVDDAGFQTVGEIPTLDLSDGDVWIDAFGRIRRPSDLGRWRR